MKNLENDDPAEELDDETRQKRRQKQREKERRRMPQHGRGLGKVYRNAITKRRRQSEENED
jgi:hypothetical protein